ncbi:amidohydrolase (plasmid) [Thermus thermophilus]|uniref:alpha-D-ribose 1-methylphosphonate 5-triphosphate diphosphatase n=1 Tax=Thermus thermophilus TaxID=274 RepID=UPI0020567C98|nr:alpha-D-ribose 1-methylphosphonate 5-triphosphate diphosphatase [Thermus thermophilus]BDG20176.1 amidohydrolase [Thermus thermophilus]BDG22738.1 amidohydrolase [Thermus thermophilus]BDG29798.1 amidohydrolase [Thermus thermophilus]
MWLSGARLVLPDRVLVEGSVRLEGGRIAEVREGFVPQGVDLRGFTLVPGVVDLHGDSLERELEPRPGVHLPLEMALSAWEARLLASGVTTAYATLAFWEGSGGLREPERALALAAQLAEARPYLHLDLRVHGRYEVSRPRGLKWVEEALGKGLLHLLSFMDHTPGQGQFRDLESYVAYMVRWLGRPEAEVRREVATLSRAAWEALEGLARKARALGVPLASHDDDSEARVALMARLGVGISEFPVTLEAARAAKGRGMAVVMGAPNALRGGSHNGNLSAHEALREGFLDALATDYLPDAALRAAFRLAAEGLLDLPRAVALVTRGPALAVGLADRGALVPGLRADLVLLKEAPLLVLGTFVEGRPVLLRGEAAHALA